MNTIKDTPAFLRFALRPGRAIGICGLSVLKGEDGRYTVIFSGLKENKGPSVTNAMEGLMTIVVERYLPSVPVGKITWIEQRAADPVRSPTAGDDYSVVTACPLPGVLHETLGIAISKTTSRDIPATGDHYWIVERPIFRDARWAPLSPEEAARLIRRASPAESSQER